MSDKSSFEQWKPDRNSRVGWGFTLNGDELTLMTALTGFYNGEIMELCKYAIMQIERAPTTGQLHLQGYIELKERHVFGWLIDNFPLLGWHWFPRRGSPSQMIVYCSKEETRVEGPFEFGDSRLGAGSRTDLLHIKKLLDEKVPLEIIARDHPDRYTSCVRYRQGLSWYENYAVEYTGNKPRDGSEPVKVYVYYGAPGLGKTKLATQKYPNAFVKSPGEKWWDGYCGEKEVIFDEFNGNWFTWDALMRVIDRQKLRVEYKGGFAKLCATTFIFTTNVHPAYWYKNMLTRYPALQRRITAFYVFRDFDVYDVISPSSRFPPVEGKAPVPDDYDERLAQMNMEEGDDQEAPSMETEELSLPPKKRPRKEKEKVVEEEEQEEEPSPLFSPPESPTSILIREREEQELIVQSEARRVGGDQGSSSGGTKRKQSFFCQKENVKTG